MHELEADPTGFAYGGVSPVAKKGSRKAKLGVHRVSYSIGLAGTYLLHVRLRKEGLPVPGSPFPLTVLPGEPVAHACFLTTEPQALGGNKAGVVLRTCDAMGNACVTGGADVTCTCPAPDAFAGASPLCGTEAAQRNQLHREIHGTGVVR